MNNNFLKVKTEKGTDVILEVLDMANDANTNKTYIVYRFLNNTDDIFISILNEAEDSFSIDTIDDIDEFNAVEQFFIDKLENDSGEMTI